MDANDFFGRLFDKGLGVGELMLERELFGEPTDAEGMTQERRRWNSRNGSGAVNEEAEARAPKGWFDFMHGESNGTTNGGGKMLWIVAGAALLVLLMVLMLKKK